MASHRQMSSTMAAVKQTNCATVTSSGDATVATSNEEHSKTFTQMCKKVAELTQVNERTGYIDASCIHLVEVNRACNKIYS